MALCAVGSRVGARFLRRLGAPAVTAMHNGSSYHALPALLSDLHGARAALLGNSSDAGGRLRRGAEACTPLGPCGRQGAPRASAPLLPCFGQLVAGMQRVSLHLQSSWSASAISKVQVHRRLRLSAYLARRNFCLSSGSSNVIMYVHDLQYITFP